MQEPEELSSDPELRKRSPYERERYLRRRLAEGASAELVGMTREVLAEWDRQEVAGLVQWTRRVVDTFCSENAAALSALPSAAAQGLIVEATIAYLYGYGLMVPTPVGEPGLHPLMWREAIPKHLHPDVAGVVAAHERMVARMFGPGDGSR